MSVVDPDALARPTGSVLGDERFTEQVAARAARASREVPRRARQRRPALETLFAGAVTRRARAERMGEAYRSGYAMVEIARYLGVHYATVSKAITAVRNGARP